MPAQLEKAKPQKYNKLIGWYKTILNRKTNVASKISDQEPDKLMVELLERITI